MTSRNHAHRPEPDSLTWPAVFATVLAVLAAWAFVVGWLSMGPAA